MNSLIGTGKHETPPYLSDLRLVDQWRDGQGQPLVDLTQQLIEAAIKEMSGFGLIDFVDSQIATGSRVMRLLRTSASMPGMGKTIEIGLQRQENGYNRLLIAAYQSTIYEYSPTIELRIHRSEHESDVELCAHHGSQPLFADADLRWIVQLADHFFDGQIADFCSSYVANCQRYYHNQLAYATRRPQGYPPPLVSHQLVPFLTEWQQNVFSY